MAVTMGVDVGSTHTKALISMADGRVVARFGLPTGYNLPRASDRAREGLLQGAGLSEADVASIAATGYGRSQVGYRQLVITELTCHGYAVHARRPDVRTILDVGGQMVKAIRLDDSGRVRAFRLNDKCAAGSGAFLEKTVRYMGYEAKDIPRLAEAAEDPVTVSSVCAVFAESEIINHLAEDRSVEDVCAGAIVALAGRAAQLLKRVRPEPPYALTGGLTRVPLMRRELERIMGEPFELLQGDEGVYAGALGAALLAQQRVGRTAEAIAG